MKKSVRYILPCITLFLLLSLLITWIIADYNEADITLKDLQKSEIFMNGKTTSRININTASAELLTLLPGIGPSTANRIIEYREENGKFIIAADLLKVPGITKNTYEVIKDLISVR